MRSPSASMTMSVGRARHARANLRTPNARTTKPPMAMYPMASLTSWAQIAMAAAAAMIARPAGIVIVAMAKSVTQEMPTSRGRRRARWATAEG
jgi:hypothetical protein